MRRKVRRIFFKTLGITFSVLLLLALGLYFGIQTYVFQTWLGQRAGSYLSSELGNTVTVEKIRLDFFTKAYMEKVLVLDMRRDTLFYGNLDADIRNFSYRKQTLKLEKLTLTGATSRIVRYKSDSTFNYDFIVDYFTPAQKDSSTSPGWNITFGDLVLDRLNFTYRDEKQDTATGPTINFSNMSLRNTSGIVSDFKVDGDTMLATIKHLGTSERSGMVLEHLGTDLKISPKQVLCRNLRLKTPGSLVKGTIDFSSQSWDDYTDFVNKVTINSELEDSTMVSFTDISRFSSPLLGLNETVRLSGRVKGTVSDLNLSGFKLAYARNTRFNGNFSISGLPDFNTSYLHFDAKEISTSYTDIVNIPMYPFSEGKKVALPYELSRLGVISYKGKFDGFVNDFTTYGKFSTALGRVNTKLSIKLGEKSGDIAYDGKIETESFNLGTLLGQKNLNALSFNGTVKGKGVDIATLDATMEAVIAQVTYNNYTYRDIKLNGSIHDKVFDGLLICKDPNADFDFNGTINFKNKVPEMDFISTINKVRLNTLNFTTRPDSGSLSSQVLINLKGDNIDNLSGQINFDNTIYDTKKRSYTLNSFNVQLDQTGEEKRVKLNSDVMNGFVKGKYKISNLAPAVENMLYAYYPSYFKKPASTKKTYRDELIFKFNVVKFNLVNELFLPDLKVSPGTRLEGNFSAADNKLNLQLNSGRLSYQAFTMQDLVFIVNESNNAVLAEASCKILNAGDGPGLENFNLSVNSFDKESRYKIDWDDLQQPADKGEVSGRITYNEKAFTLISEKINITVNDTAWTMGGEGSVQMDKDKRLVVSPFTISNRLQSLAMAGVLSNKPGDSLVISAANLVLSQFNPLLRLLNLKLEGVMNGDISLSNANENFVFDGNLSLASFKLNDNTIGELSLNANYVTSQKYIKLNGYTSLGMKDPVLGNQVKNLAFNGTYYLDRKEESIDLAFTANPANLKLLNPLLAGIITIKEGFVNGEGRIHGSPDNLKIDGKLRLFNSEIKVDYTNVSYKISGDIEIMPDQIRFSDLLMREVSVKGAPQGTINGNVFHSNFKKIQLDYDVTYHNMMVLNTTAKDNKIFYGRIFGSGNVGIYGFLNDLHMVVTDTTTRGSKFFLPLDGPAEISEDDFVRFVKRDSVKVVKDAGLSGFSLELGIYVTPALQTQIILDKQNGDVLNAQGQGQLRMRINTLGKFEMFGDYIITNGDYLFTMANVINKKFEIDAGSSISWSGNPLNAEIDVVTSYKQRASVAPLLNDTTGQYKARFPVDCKLLITGKLFSPNINFAIDFPNIDATARARINNILSDEAELNRQVVSFLLFRTFVTPQIYSTNGGGVTAGNAAASTGSELLSNRVSEFLNTYFGNVTGLKDVQLGLNYRPGTQNNSEAVDLALSKQFLNNKITVDGNFGVNNNQARSSNSNSFIGDVNVSYKLSDDGRFRLKGFNRTNDNTQITTAGGPYTQGVGFFYREEFETFTQLFAMYMKKFKKKEKPAVVAAPAQ